MCSSFVEDNTVQRKVLTHCLLPHFFYHDSWPRCSKSNKSRSRVGTQPFGYCTATHLISWSSSVAFLGWVCPFSYRHHHHEELTMGAFFSFCFHFFRSRTGLQCLSFHQFGKDFDSKPWVFYWLIFFQLIEPYWETWNFFFLVEHLE